MSNRRLELIEEMLEKNPGDTFLNYAAALEFKKIGDNGKAIDLFEGLLECDPKYLATYYQLGKMYEENDRAEDAIKVYREGKELARKQNDVKTLGELSEALLILDADDEYW